MARLALLALRDVIAAGPRAVSRYTGTLLAVFVAQTLVAGACTLAVAVVLAQAFAHLPMFDEAVDGDLVALVYCARHAKANLAAIGGVVFGAILLWQLASWFITGGIYGVLAQRPEGRGDTARRFGASGATTYLAYARLAVCALPGWIIVLFALGTGLGLASEHLAHALTVFDLVWPLAAATLPAALLFHLLGTVTDYARVELTLRHDSHAPGVVATYARSLVYVLRRPITLVHGALGWLVFALVTAAYAYLAQGHPMYGADGAVTLFIARQGVSLIRMATRFGVLAGQVELGRTRPPPPRRVEITVDVQA